MRNLTFSADAYRLAEIAAKFSPPIIAATDTEKAKRALALVEACALREDPL